MRKQVRAGQALKVADLGKPDLVQRDQNVTLIYESAGLYLTIRGKALEGGTEGDVVNVLNLQSKRTVSGVVIGREQVAISVATPRLPATSLPAPSLPPATDQTPSTVGANERTAPVSIASSNPAVAPKTE
jgi:flagellar basal body P-ring formation protein FlgA